MATSTEKLRLRVYLGIFFAVMLLGTLGFMVIERHSFLNAIYFTIVTIATVGYGDISPVTPLGKVLAVILMVTGIGTFVGVVANATELFLNRREGRARMAKLNMIIGLFFSETGSALLRQFVGADPGTGGDERKMIISDSWTPRDFQDLRTSLSTETFKVEVDRLDLDHLRGFLNTSGNMMARLLENPSMLEHEAFTDLLIAGLHLKEELLSRESLSCLPDSDRQHLCGDVNRVYGLLARQWVDYMEHLKDHYPFLFSLAVRTNPFDRGASPMVR